MSIHAQLSQEAQARLNAQKRTSTISSIVISILVIVMILLVLGIFLLPNITKDIPTIVTYSASLTEDTDLNVKKINNQIQRKPSAPSSSMAKVIAASTSSPTAIPVPDIDVITPNADFGDGEDFGGGWGDGDGTSAGGGFANIPQTMRKRCSKEDRMQRLQEMGGNPLAEEVVEKALEWLKATQNENGSWTKKHQAAMTGFGILAYLGRCETPLSEKYGESCLEAITYLVNLGMKTGGKMGTDLAYDHWCYEHAIATYALCEATTFCKQLGINIPNLAEVTTMAIDFTIANQHVKSGGWDYSYDTTGSRGGDTSIVAWHIQSLKAAKHTGIEFKGFNKSFSRAVDYIESKQAENGGFGYTSSSGGNAQSKDYLTMTGGCGLALQMGGKESSSAVRKAAKYIIENSKFDYNTEFADLYGHYYECQMMMIRGGKDWEKYNLMFRDQLINNQNPDGSFKKPGGGAGKIRAVGDQFSGNVHYRTCLCILMLEVYYRFLPGTAAK